MDDAAPHFAAAIERMHLGQADGLAAASYDSGPSGGSSSSSVPERLTIAGRGDPAGDALAEVDRMLRYLGENMQRPSVGAKRITSNARTLWHLVEVWRPKDAGEKQKAIAEATAPAAEPLCEHCTPHRAKGHAERVHRTGDAAGNLTDGPLSLCHWCYRFVLRVGRLPLKSEIVRNDNGQRVMVKA